MNGTLTLGENIADLAGLGAAFDAFDVLPGQGLYLDPKARVRVW